MGQHGGMTTTPPTAAVILAGGRGTRMGGVDKPGLLVHGRRLLDIALSATSHLDAVVVVGPHRPELDPGITQTQESPAGAGPVEAIWAGLSATRLPDNAVVVVLASDLPHIEAESVDALIAATSTDNPVTCAVDENNRTQFLFSAWTFRELRQRLSTLRESSGLENQPMKAIVTEPFSTLSVAGTTDCDTPEDIDRARSHPRLTIDQARAAVRNSLTALPPHRADLADSLGATLAQPLVALGDLPRSDVSAMDGYAVSGEGPWRIRTEIRIAGADGQLELGEGEAIRIATGAHLPLGATSVIRDEYLSVDEPSRMVRRLPDAPHRNDARPRGEDWTTGFTIAPTGTAVTPAVISAAASGEVFDALVRGPVRARLIVTGDEIRRTGPLREGQTRDSVGGILPYLLESNGVRCVANSHLRDTADSFERVLADGVDQEADLLVVIGATGGGAADEMRSALDRLGARTIVGRVASRPGGSQITAVLPSGLVVLGLPGNPYAAVTTLLTMLPTVVAALTGSDTPPPLLGIIENAAAVSSDAVRLLPVTQSEDGRWRADPSVRTAHLAGLIERSAFALVPAHSDDGAVAELVVLPR